MHIDGYQVLSLAGEGSYGIVLKCRDTKTGEIVAIKQFKGPDDESSIRELKILGLVSHPNIVKMKSTFRKGGRLHIVFEFVPKNLLNMIEASPQGLPQDIVRLYVKQLVRSLELCHRNNIIHRDIKPENILIHPGSKGMESLKICDFGVARFCGQQGQRLTGYVATRWYRAPELLLGQGSYGQAVDMWAVGCIMAEIVDGRPLFPGASDIDQVHLIEKMIGKLTDSQTREIKKHHGSAIIHTRHGDYGNCRKTIEGLYSSYLSPDGVDFLVRLLIIDPLQRPTAEEALRHPYLAEGESSFRKQEEGVEEVGEEEGVIATAIEEQEQGQKGAHINYKAEDALHPPLEVMEDPFLARREREKEKEVSGQGQGQVKLVEPVEEIAAAIDDLNRSHGYDDDFEVDEQPSVVRHVKEKAPVVSPSSLAQSFKKLSLSPKPSPSKRRRREGKGRDRRSHGNSINSNSSSSNQSSAPSNGNGNSLPVEEFKNSNQSSDAIPGDRTIHANSKEKENRFQGNDPGQDEVRYALPNPYSNPNVNPETLTSVKGPADGGVKHLKPVAPPTKRRKDQGLFHHKVLVDKSRPTVDGSLAGGSHLPLPPVYKHGLKIRDEGGLNHNHNPLGSIDVIISSPRKFLNGDFLGDGTYPSDDVYVSPKKKRQHREKISRALMANAYAGGSRFENHNRHFIEFGVTRDTKERVEHVHPLRGGVKPDGKGGSGGGDVQPYSQITLPIPQQPSAYGGGGGYLAKDLSKTKPLSFNRGGRHRVLVHRQPAGGGGSPPHQAAHH